MEGGLLRLQPRGFSCKLNSRAMPQGKVMRVPRPCATAAPAAGGSLALVTIGKGTDFRMRYNIDFQWKATIYYQGLSGLVTFIRTISVRERHKLLLR